MSRVLWGKLLRNACCSADVSTRARDFGPRGIRRYWTGPARLLDGRAHASQWKKEIAESVAKRGEVRPGVPPPGLAAVVVGDRTDSALYVKRKGEAASLAGMRFFHEHLPKDVDQETVLRVLHELNANDDVHGVLLQLPLPSHLDESRLLEAINPRKDVDGLHPNNVGRLAMRGVWRPAFMPCAPLGAMELLRRSGISVRNKSVAVIGDSNVVGMPMSWLLRDAGASAITVVHSQGVNFLKRFAERAKEDGLKNSDSNSDEKPTTKNSLTLEKKRYELLRSVRRADVVISAVGSPGLVRKDWIKPGAVVVDIGINAVPLSVAEKNAAEELADEKRNDAKSNLYSLPVRFPIYHIPPTECRYETDISFYNLRGKSFFAS